ncbi:MAG: nickel-dependent lactate racemase [Deltaproteobacteria bacterium]|nr:MAG: nickel-dependent lactate racemase [Deltaproteobacteria bacterium]
MSRCRRILCRSNNMTTVEIPFDGHPLAFDVPDDNFIETLSPAPSSPVADLDGKIENALDRPIGQALLEDRVKPTDRVILVSDDNTRLTPVDRIIPALLRRLNKAGVPDDRISCVMALGTHRYMTDEEMAAKVSPEIFGRIHVFNHLWRDPDTLVDFGSSNQGTPLQINRAVVDADVVIGLGAIVPHHIAGYSGASKIIQPGVCGAATTAQTHMLSCESGGDSFLGIADNPVRRDMDDMADKVGLKTIFNVVMNSEGGVVGLFFGDTRAAFKEGIKLAREIYGVEYSETPDIVVANSHPCNLDFWQAHKSQYPAQRMVKPGGTIIVCTPAPEGVSPVHTELLDFTAWSSDEIKSAFQQGKLSNGVAAALAVAWAMVREKAPVIMVSPGISPEDKARLGHAHAPDISSALTEAFRRQGPSARVTVLTHAPEMLPVQSTGRPGVSGAL